MDENKKQQDSGGLSTESDSTVGITPDDSQNSESTNTETDG